MTASTAKRLTWLTFGTFVTMASTTSAASNATFVYRTIAVTGQQAPGAEPGVTFFNQLEDDLGTSPRIDADGVVAFAAFLAGEGLSVNEQAIWLEMRGELVMVMRNGDPAPGAPPRSILITSGLFPLSPHVAGGDIAFRGITSVPGQATPSAGIWSNPNGGLELVILGGTQAPGLPSGVIFPERGVGQPLFNTRGHTLFGSTLSGTGVNENNNESIWSNRTGAPALIVREGDAAPGTNAVFGASNSIFAPGGLRSFAFNSQSQMALYGNLTGSGVDDFNDEGIWVEAAGELSLLVREGDPAPGFGPKVAIAAGNGIDVFVGPLFNAKGTVFFGADMTGLPELELPNSGFEGIWSTRTGELAIVAHYGQQPPGEPEDSFFVGFARLAFNNADQAAFVAVLPPGSFIGGDFADFGIFWESTGALTMLLRDGTQVPDLPEGVIFGTTAASVALAFELFSYSANGHLLFTSFLTGSGIDTGNNFGLFLAAPDGVIHTLVRRGDLFDVHQDGTDLRPVIDILPGGVSTDGESVFKLLFADGTIAVVTANLKTQPCASHSDCDDGLFCNGEERCSATFRCEVGIPPDCEDPFVCTADACDETTKSCIHSLCGDSDSDGDVDLDDFAAFRQCFLDPAGLTPPGCEVFDFDSDGEIDLHDFGGLQVAFTGP